MALGFNNSPVNWDNSQSLLNNRTGEYYGQAIQQLGQVASTAIGQFRQQQEQKKQDEAGMNLLKQFAPKLGVQFKDDAEAKAAYKAMGGFDGIQKAMQGVKSAEYMDVQIGTMKAALTKEQKDSEAMTQAIAESMPLGGSDFKNGRPWSVNGGGGIDLDKAAQIYLRKGGSPEKLDSIGRYAAAMAKANKTESPLAFVEDPVSGARFATNGNTVLPSNSPKPPKKELEPLPQPEIDASGKYFRSVKDGPWRQISDGNAMTDVLAAILTKGGSKSGVTAGSDANNPIDVKTPEEVLSSVKVGQYYRTPTGQVRQRAK